MSVFLGRLHELAHKPSPTLDLADDVVEVGIVLFCTDHAMARRVMRGTGVRLSKRGNPSNRYGKEKPAMVRHGGPLMLQLRFGWFSQP
jgi:hypothetical protein